MLSTFKKALEELESSFSKKSKDVRSASSSLEANLLNFKKEVDLNNISKGSIKQLLPIIEKLSIQNDYKLDLIREFPNYILNKK